MAELSDILQFLAQSAREERQDRREDARIYLQQLNLALNAESTVLKSKLDNEYYKERKLLEDFNEKNESLAAITGSLQDLETDFDNAPALQIIDQTSHPVLDKFENEIHRIQDKSNTLKYAISETDKKLKLIGKIDDFFGGETATFKGGLDPEAWDIGDFGYKPAHPDWEESQGPVATAGGTTYPASWEDAKLKFALGLQKGDPIPDWVSDYITKQKSTLDVKITELNKSLDSAVNVGIANQIEEYRLNKLNLPSSATLEFLNNIDISIKTRLDPIMADISIDSFSSAISLSLDIADFKQTYDMTDEAAVLQLQTMEDQLDQIKIGIGAKLTQGTNEKYNMDLASKLLTGVQLYNDSMGGKTREYLTFIHSLEELRMIDKDLMMKAFQPNASDSDKSKYEKFKLAIQEFTNWEYDQFQENADALVRDADIYINESGVLIDQLLIEKAKESEKLEKNKEIEENLDDSATQFLLQSQSPGSPEQGDVDYEHGYDEKYRAAYGHLDDDQYGLLMNNFGIDTNQDGVMDAFDMDNDGVADIPGMGPTSNYTTQVVQGEGDPYPLINTGENEETYIGDDYIYNWQTKELKDKFDGSLERKITDEAEMIYFTHYGQMEPKFGANSTINKDYQGSVDAIYKMPVDIWTATIPLLAVHDKAYVNRFLNKQSNIYFNKKRLIDALESVQMVGLGKVGLGDLGGKWPDATTGAGNDFTLISPTWQVKPSELYSPDGYKSPTKYQYMVDFAGVDNYGFPTIHGQKGMDFSTPPVPNLGGMPFGGPKHLPNYNLVTALGGGHYFHNHSPYYQVYTDILLLEWNNLIEHDDDIWFKAWHKETEMGEWWAEMPILGWGESDIQYIDNIKERYGEDTWNKINERAHEYAYQYQKNYLYNTLMGLGTVVSNENQYVSSGGNKYKPAPLDFDKEDQYDILRVLAGKYNISF